MKYKKASIFLLILVLALIACVTTAFAISANEQAQQAEFVNQSGNIEIISKPDYIPQVADTFGAFFKDDGKSAELDADNTQTATLVQSGEIFSTPIDKTSSTLNDLPENNVVYFDTEAERDEHFSALDANMEKGLDRYAGFETTYADIDTSAPITYIVK